MTPETSLFPPAVYAIWWVTLIVTLVLFVPLSLFLLHRTWKAARAIDRYAAETLTAATGIVANTRNIAALDATIGVASQMLGGAGAAAQKLDTIANVLAERAE
jgi:cytochrome c biogenesis protein ResB